MTTTTLSSAQWDQTHSQAFPAQQTPEPKNPAAPELITREASTRTHLIIRLLVDRDRTMDAYRAYAYFRWVDDWLDQTSMDRDARIAFVRRQQSLIDRAYAGERLHTPTVEEQMVVDLIHSDHTPNSALQTYIQNMMVVMAFDADRRGRRISAHELDEYSRYLATGVTEALHYFIGHGEPPPASTARYRAVAAAHITHMLRDTCEDFAAGYFNIPGEYLTAHGISPGDISSEAYREWVKSRVQLARDHFKAGRDYLAQVPNLRCRIAGYAYCTQFEKVLDAIEKNAYWLHFNEQKERI
ncbi:MAG: squalene/phytoene synthase family protein [Chloroflexi bacterium]|nr:squalene/phytoene synthase family protein [Chloroflexota bacterium]